MILRRSGLGDPTTESDPWESQEASAWTPAATAAANEDNPVTVDGPASSITFFPATVRPAVPRVGATKVLDRVMPKKATGPGGAVRIWGLPPAVAYTLAAAVLGGVGWWAYREFAGGRRVASNPRRRGKRGAKARRKR
jgi:hypothetical protein